MPNIKLPPGKRKMSKTYSIEKGTVDTFDAVCRDMGIDNPSSKVQELLDEFIIFNMKK